MKRLLTLFVLLFTIVFLAFKAPNCGRNNKASNVTCYSCHSSSINTDIIIQPGKWEEIEVVNPINQNPPVTSVNNVNDESANTNNNTNNHNNEAEGIQNTTADNNTGNQETNQENEPENDLTEQTKLNRFSVYPSFASNHVTIETPIAQTVMIFDAQGKLILQNTVEPQTKLDVSTWQSGIYFAKNTYGETVKFVVR